MKPLRIHDIIGPIMVGPSSSHTAGALRIASMARRLFQEQPDRVEFLLFGSFAHTFQGHGTDRALVAGILGFGTADIRIRDSLVIAQQAGIDVSFTPCPEGAFDHPNTVEIVMDSTDGASMRIRGESIGGGSAVLTQIDGVDVFITGELTSLIITQHDEPGVLAHISTAVSRLGINIASSRMFRKHRGDIAYTIMETDDPLPHGLADAILASPAVSTVRFIPADDSSDRLPGVSGTEGFATPNEPADESFGLLDFANGKALLTYCEQKGCTISDAFGAREAALAASLGKTDNTDTYLQNVLDVMRNAAQSPEVDSRSSMGGLIGGEAKKLAALSQKERGVCDPLLATCTRYALATLETNASMGIIVASPTAGSSGVIPAVLLSLAEDRGLNDVDLKRGLITAAAIGCIISRNATVSGAEGGCQAEIGSAAGMAAAAITELCGGTPAQCLAAAANAIANLMGLVCDPICGLVETPCQKRNATGAANALISAEIALAGIENLVDFDETVEAMYRVGRAMPFELRETALGGMAATPSACARCRQ